MHCVLFVPAVIYKIYSVDHYLPKQLFHILKGEVTAFSMAVAIFQFFLIKVITVTIIIHVKPRWQVNTALQKQTYHFTPSHSGQSVCRPTGYIVI